MRRGGGEEGVRLNCIFARLTGALNLVSPARWRIPQRVTSARISRGVGDIRRRLKRRRATSGRRRGVVGASGASAGEGGRRGVSRCLAPLGDSARASGPTTRVIGKCVDVPARVAIGDSLSRHGTDAAKRDDDARIDDDSVISRLGGAEWREKIAAGCHALVPPSLIAY